MYTASYTHIVERQNQEGTAAGHLGDHGQELGVDSAELRVVGVLGDLDVVVAPLPLGRRPVHVPELAAPHAPKPRLDFARTIQTKQIVRQLVSPFFFFLFPCGATRVPFVAARAGAISDELFSARARLS